MASEDSKRARSSNDEIVVNEFTEAAAQEFRNKVMDIAKEDPTKPIVIYIDSYGGYVDSLSKMIETMDEAPNPFVTVAIGKSMSCGAVLLSHGDVRFCGKHARVMVHEVSSGFEGDVHDLCASAEETKRLNKWFMGLLAKNCGIKGGYEALRKLIKNKDGRDQYMSAEAALKFGIVDVIGMPRISRIRLYSIDTVPAKESEIKSKIRKKRAGKKI